MDIVCILLKQCARDCNVIRRSCLTDSHSKLFCPNPGERGERSCSDYRVAPIINTSDNMNRRRIRIVAKKRLEIAANLCYNAHATFSVL